MADTYIPPVEVSKNAQQALTVRRTKPVSERGMTLVGLARANQLSKREPISIETIKRMVAYFDRHEVDKEGSTWDSQGKGWQAWFGWGGDEGRRWAESILKEKSMEVKSTENLTEHQQLMATALLEITHEAGKFDKSTMGNGAHYAPAESNPFKAEGLICANCYFFQPLGQCAIVAGDIENEAICKLWIIPEDELVGTEETPTEEAEMPDEESAVMPIQPEEMVMEQANVLNIEGKIITTQAERDAMPTEDFAIPSSRNFPIDSPVAVSDAVSSWGRYRGDVSFETFKQNLIRIATRKGPAYVDALPQSWKDELAQATKSLVQQLLARLI